MTNVRPRFLKAIRRRIRWAWFAASAQAAAPFMAGAGLLLALSGALFDLGPGAFAVLAGGLGAVAALLVLRALTFRISDWDAARTAERGLGIPDLLTTALEFTDESDPFHRAIQRQAEEAVSGSNPREAVRVGAQRDRLTLTAALAAAALIVALVLPHAGLTRSRTALDDALDEEAAQVEKLADAVDSAGVERGDETSAELRDLAKALREAGSFDKALSELDRTRSRLAAGVDQRRLRQKAAVQGLSRDLALHPLFAGAPIDAASQLDALADALSDLSDAERAALQERLERLAGAQSAGNPAVAAGLQSAASALASGNLAAAGSALRSAAGGQREGVAAARSQQALEETLRALGGVEARLSAAQGALVRGTGEADGGAQGDGTGAGQGQGQGQGNGNGQGEGGGDGDGNGSGQGQGQGQGQGNNQGDAGGGGGGQGGTAGNSGPSGQISGVRAGDGNAQGQGGSGSVGAGPGAEVTTDVKTRTVYDPVDPGGVSVQLQVGIDGEAGQGDVVGRGDAPTLAGESLVPYTEVLPAYLAEASRALEQLDLPPSLRGVVRDYFGLLAQEAR